MLDGSSLVEPVLSYDKCVLLKDHNAVTQVRLEPTALRSRVKHSTTEPLRSLLKDVKGYKSYGVNKLSSTEGRTDGHGLKRNKHIKCHSRLQQMTNFATFSLIFDKNKI